MDCLVDIRHIIKALEQVDDILVKSCVTDALLTVFKNLQYIVSLNKKVMKEISFPFSNGSYLIRVEDESKFKLLSEIHSFGELLSTALPDSKTTIQGFICTCVDQVLRSK